MHNVHERGPRTFHTRWALSYLSGPMTRTQIKKLMAEKKAALATPAAPAAVMAHDTPTRRPPRHPPPRRRGCWCRPARLAAQVPQVFLPIRRASGSAEIVYEPRLLAIGKVHFVDTRKDLAADEDIALLASMDRGAFGIDWDEAARIELTPDDLEQEPPLPGVSQMSAPRPRNRRATRPGVKSWKTISIGRGAIACSVANSSALIPNRAKRNVIFASAWPSALERNAMSTLRSCVTSTRRGWPPRKNECERPLESRPRA